MKHNYFLWLILFIFSGSCTSDKKSPMEGAWRLAVEYKISGDTVTTIFPGLNKGSEIKMWSERNFTFIGRFENDSTFTDNFGGGTYKLEGNKYEEYVQYHSLPEYLGKTVKLFLEIKGDTLTQTWPVDDNGQIFEGVHYTEKWVRL